MEQEEAYYPYQERTTKELCSDIILKAEKLYLKSDKRGLLIFAIFFLVCVALNWYFKIFKGWWLLCAWLVAVFVVYFAFFIINRKLINDMNLAANPKQLLPMAKRLKKCVQYRNFVFETLSFWLFISQFMPSPNDEWWWSVISFIPALIIALVVVKIRRAPEKEADFNDDLDELEYRLEE
jgi:hypothetical protein